MSRMSTRSLIATLSMLENVAHLTPPSKNDPRMTLLWRMNSGTADAPSPAHNGRGDQINIQRIIQSGSAGSICFCTGRARKIQHDKSTGRRTNGRDTPGGVR